jgi:hypothetical protein
MKNPFKRVTTGPASIDKFGILVLEDGSNIPHLPMYAASARYAAHAINQHDKLVEMLKKLEWHGGCEREHYGLCPSCGRRKELGHFASCKLAAMLAEEKEK